jgi:hypothetical protein
MDVPPSEDDDTRKRRLIEELWENGPPGFLYYELPIGVYVLQEEDIRALSTAFGVTQTDLEVQPSNSHDTGLLVWPLCPHAPFPVLRVRNPRSAPTNCPVGKANHPLIQAGHGGRRGEPSVNFMLRGTR